MGYERFLDVIEENGHSIMFYVGCMLSSQLDKSGHSYDNCRLVRVRSIWDNFALVRL